MDLFLAEIMPSIFEVLAIIVVALLGWVMSALKKWATEKGLLDQLKQYEWLAEIAVRSAEDAFKHQDSKGREKLEFAKTRFLELLPKSAQVNQPQLDSFIRDAYMRTVDEWQAEDVLLTDYYKTLEND